MSSSTAAFAQVTTLATHTASSAWNIASDFLIILVLVAFFFAFAWYVGRGPFVAIMLSYYGAYAIYMTFPYEKFLPQAPALTALLAHAGVYAALGFGFYVVLRRVVVSDFLYVGNIGLIVLSFLASAFLIALAYHVFPVATVYHFTPALDILFAAKAYFFWWFVAPAVGLFFLAR
ncbi:MAG: hypothetical protein JWN18_564 [Parcubacteria group bacterium]|nr:hypothetical protein [Parcubacteria group bacterium]